MLYQSGKSDGAATFILVVSLASLLHDVSAGASDVSMGMAVLPIG